MQKADELVCNTESEPTCLQIPSTPGVETAVSVESLGSDTSVSELQLEAPEEEVSRCLKISQFQKIMDNV